MRCYRLTRECYKQLDGEGSRLYGGRWNSSGKAIVYTSASIALCVLEQLVHLDFEFIPNDYCVLTIECPDFASIQSIEILPTTQRSCRTIGDRWYASNAALILKVPSAVIPLENNYLFNPNHPAMSDVHIIEERAFQLDPRLRQTTSERR